MNVDHYTIRPLEQTDSAAFFDLIQRNRVRLEDFFAGMVSRARTPEETEEYVAWLMTRVAEKAYFPFLVIAENGNIAGLIDVKNIDWNIPKGELGCFMDERYAGRGLTKNLMLAAMAHVTTEHGFKKLFLRTHETNTAARKLAENCGFEIEGKIRRDYKTTKGELVDLIYYGILL